MNRELRPEILETARHMFNERGYNDVSMRDIAGELHISVGNLTYYFRTKKELVEAVVLDRQGQYHKPTSFQTLEALDGFFMRMLHHQRENVYYFRHYKQLAHLSETVYRIQVAAMEDIITALRESFALLRQGGYMEPEALPDQTEQLIDALLSVLIYGTLRHMDQRDRCLWSLLYPMLTPAGRVEFHTRIFLTWSANAPGS